MPVSLLSADSPVSSTVVVVGAVVVGAVVLGSVAVAVLGSVAWVLDIDALAESVLGPSVAESAPSSSSVEPQAAGSSARNKVPVQMEDQVERSRTAAV
jgi:hypothetical protein